MRKHPQSRSSASDVYYFKGTAGTGAGFIVSANSSQFRVVDWIAWSFDAVPDTPLYIEFGTPPVIAWRVDITSAGPGFVPFRAPLYGALGEKLAVTFNNPANLAIGKVTFSHR